MPTKNPESTLPHFDADLTRYFEANQILATPEKASHMKLAAAQFELLQSKDFEGDVTLGFAAVHPISFT